MRMPVEEATISHLPVLGGTEALRAVYRHHHFAPHTHDTFAIGVFQCGAAVINCEGSTFTAGQPTILTINPGSVHSARSADDAEWHYRAFYPECAAVREMLADAEIGTDALFFARPYREDPRLAHHVSTALASLESEPEALACEEVLLQVVRTLWAPGNRAGVGARTMPAMVQRAREFIEANAHRPITLGEVSAAAGSSRYHLVRAFTASLGISPYAYYLQRRIQAARDLLTDGWSPSVVSSVCGFADQSHLTRQFKRIVGVTPGEYSASSRRRGRSRKRGEPLAPRVGPP